MVKSPPNAAEITMSYPTPLLYFQLLWFMVLSYSTAMQFLSYSCTVFELLYYSCLASTTVFELYLSFWATTALDLLQLLWSNYSFWATPVLELLQFLSYFYSFRAILQFLSYYTAFELLHFFELLQLWALTVFELATIYSSFELLKLWATTAFELLKFWATTAFERLQLLSNSSFWATPVFELSATTAFELLQFLSNSSFWATKVFELLQLLSYVTVRTSSGRGSVAVVPCLGFCSAGTWDMVVLVVAAGCRWLPLLSQVRINTVLNVGWYRVMLSSLALVLVALWPLLSGWLHLLLFFLDSLMQVEPGICRRSGIYAWLQVPTKWFWRCTLNVWAKNENSWSLPHDGVVLLQGDNECVVFGLLWADSNAHQYVN
jgi:hypothetical protein